MHFPVSFTTFASSLIVSPSLMVPCALNQAFIDGVTRFNGRLPRTKMQVLKPGHLLSSNQDHMTFNTDNINCGEQGWGSCCLISQVNLSVAKEEWNGS